MFSKILCLVSITVNGKDPVWKNENIKSKIKTRKLLCASWNFYKWTYWVKKKLNNPLLQTKTYWSILKTFYNEKKIPLIPPLLVKDRFVTDAKTKANIFNNFFAE